MPGFENVFQRMDETIVDVCLRDKLLKINLKIIH